LRPMNTCWKALEVYFQMDQTPYQKTVGLPNMG
jgi:hypothetical protein